ncbi:MAG: hypothetical protein GWN58_26330 [Anaerolineae bacterium]|nr:hypothetical protein [Anaerolineae bacterium]
MLRLASDNPFDLQIAVLNLAMLEARVSGEEIYVGMCGCEGSIQHRVIILSARPQDGCVFCGVKVELTHIPHYPPLERRIATPNGQTTT